MYFASNIGKGFRTRLYLDVLRVCIFTVTGENTEIFALLQRIKLSGLEQLG